MLKPQSSKLPEIGGSKVKRGDNEEWPFEGQGVGGVIPPKFPPTKQSPYPHSHRTPSALSPHSKKNDVGRASAHLKASKVTPMKSCECYKS